MRSMTSQWGYFSVASAEGNRSERQEAYRKYHQGFLDIREFELSLRLPLTSLISSFTSSDHISLDHRS